ncbi:Fc receptor-like protein 5 [Rhynchocyon petersi]
MPKLGLEITWWVTIVPLSKPVLTINPPKNVAFEGEIMTFHCEAQSGSLPVLYKFYHDNSIFHKIKVPEREDSFLGSFKVSVTEENSGKYHCSAENYMGIQYSKKISLLVKELLLHPELKYKLSWSAEEILMTLTCETQLPSEMSDTQLQFRFFRNNQELGSSWSHSSEFQIPAKMCNEGHYSCSAKTEASNKWQQSQGVWTCLQVPVSQPVFTLKLPGSLAIEGHLVTLCCEVQRGSPTILFHFYHENTILKSSSVFYERKASFSFSLTEQHSGNYHCTADNGLGPKHSEVAKLFVIVPVSQPVLTFGTSGIQAVEGNLMELHCETQKGSLPILYQFYHEDVILEKISAISGRRGSFSLLLTEDHSGNYHCTADNGLGAQRSYTVSLNVAVPLSRPLLTIWTPRTPAVIGDVIQLHCEVQKGSSPILYKFYYEDTILGNSSVLSGRRALFNLSLTTEHSGNYSCEASNSLGAQLSEMKTLKVKVPVSCPVLTLRAPEAQVMVGDMVELHCESWRGSPPIQYQFYHEDVILRNSSVSFRGGVSFNLSLTIKHSGNYSCEADNGLGAQRSEVLTLSVRGRKPASDPSRSPSNSDAREPTYHNVPAWIELQPVYSNVNLKGGDVVYSEIKHFREEKTHAGEDGLNPSLLA